jgi:hypothetical protein
MTTPIRTSLSQIDFGNEAGDDVLPEDVLDFFVEQPDFYQFLDEKKKILMATAKKGVGKSALIQWIEAKVEERCGDKVIVINCKGSDLVRSNFKLTTQPSLPNEFIQDWKIRICALINRRIGAEIGLAITDDDMTLVESAEIEGFRRRSIVTSLTDRFSKLLPEKLRAEKMQVSNEIELLKRVGRRKVWFLVDDLDATYQRSDRENLELSTFFSACRALSTQVSGICFRVTMRTDVWPLIRRYDESLDKFEQYVKDITWSQSEFRSLLAKRVQAQSSTHDHKHQDGDTPQPSLIAQEEKTIAEVFDNAMAWGDKQKPVYQVVYTLSYHRPRWAIQLCKLAQADAIQRNQALINKINIDTVWGDYGKKRIDDLIVEHKHQCKEVEELINSFRGAPRRVNRDELIDWIQRHVTTHVTPVIEGRQVTSALDIAHFLYRLGFIVARTEREDSGYEHFFFADMPDFLTSRTNKDFGSLWEVHPCYREALDIQKLNANQKRRRDFAR